MRAAHDPGVRLPRLVQVVRVAAFAAKQCRILRAWDGLPDSIRIHRAIIAEAKSESGTDFAAAEFRKALGYSQEEFASLMGVSVATLRNWEQARREPHGPARSLLLVASTNPAAVRGAFEKLARVQRKRRAAH
jgi:putative transcriptional regulator